MTSKSTREEDVQAVFDLKAGYTLGLADVEILKRVARMALATMDSEPVAEVVSIYGDPEAFGEREIRPLAGIQQMPYGTKLYRHAQPAPVVPEKATVGEMPFLGTSEGAYVSGWNDCRAAMLQAGYAVRDLSTPVDPQVAEYEQNVMQAGNSPVISDGYVMVPKEPTDEMLAAAKEWTGLTSTAETVYIKMLAAAPKEVR
jgi:hypothetical protein